MVVHHIVLFKLKKDLSQQQRDEFQSACREGLAKIPYGTSQVSGPPIYDAKAAGFEFGLYRSLKDLDEFKSYRECDEHMALLTGPVKDAVADGFVPNSRMTAGQAVGGSSGGGAKGPGRWES